MIKHILSAMLGIALCACEHSTSRSPLAIDTRGNDNLSIRTSKPEYTWRSNDLGATQQIHAFITNQTERTYYATLGDGFNAALEQGRLFVAAETGGYLEQLNAAGTWSALPRNLLIEGTRTIILRPQKTYQLLAPLRGNEAGTFRLKTEYFEEMNPAPGKPPLADYSNYFNIKPR